MSVNRKSNDAIHFLKTVGLFRGLSDKTLNILNQNIQERNYSNHEFIYQKGSISTHLYIIRYGEIMLHLGEMGETVRFLGQGDVFSENSVLTATKHTGSAVSTLDSVIYALDGNVFLKIAEKEMVLSQNLVKLMSARMRDQMTHSKGSVRRLICHIPMEPIPEFRERIRTIERIQKESGKISTRLIDMHQFRDDSNETIIRKLSDLRNRIPVIHLYSTDPETAQRMEFLVQQCDHIVFWEHDIYKMMNQKSLLLSFWKSRIRNFEGRTIRFTDSGKRLYIEGQARDQKYHYKTETLSRFLISKTRGLALGGGGARSLAHVGLIRTLEKEKISLDYISGSSMGAVIAALYARGENSKDLSSLVMKFFDKLNNPFDPRLPVVSFFSGNNIKRMLKDVFGNEMIEDLAIPFSTSAVDLDTGMEHVFDRGPVWEALMCAISLPGAFPPYLMGRKLLIDGGVLNNVPESLLRTMGADIVLGVNVSPFRDHGLFKLLEDRKISGRSFLQNLIENFKYPPILKIMGRAITVEGREITMLKKKSMDLFLHFHLEEFNLFDFGSHREIIAKGEYEALENLPEIKKLFLSGLTK